MQTTDVLLIGAGAMSSTLAMLLKELDPALEMTMLERLDRVAEESTSGWNNAGTGHAAWCELNYTPEQADGKLNADKAYEINEAFETTLQFWAYLVKTGALPYPEQFINPTPHLSFVWGEENVEYLYKRYTLLKAHPMFKDMEYSDDPEIIRQWVPLIMEGRDPEQKVAATRIAYGTDVNFGALSRLMIDNLDSAGNFSLRLNHEVEHLYRQDNSRWIVCYFDRNKGVRETIEARFVFLGAGGAALSLLQKSGISQASGYGGFPVGGQWLVCRKPEVVSRHHAKVYGKAAIGAPPMSVPHLDTRIIDGKPALLFGPFAGFTTRFLKHGSFLDLLGSINFSNLIPMLTVGLNNIPLIRYLITEVLQTKGSRLASLRNYFPDAKQEDWELAHAGKRVQIIKRCSATTGRIEFGTEVVISTDKSLAALLGASPGASTVVKTMTDLIEQCFAERMQEKDWQEKMQTMIPSWKKSLINDPGLLDKIRQNNLAVLKLAPVEAAVNIPEQKSAVTSES